MDKATIIGLLIGIGAILMGNAIEGGHVSSLIQGTAALIVFGGTLGAVMVGTPSADFRRGFRLLRWAFRDQATEDPRPIVLSIVELAKKARKESILALEKDVKTIQHPHLKNAMRMIIDGVQAETLREVIEADIDQEELRLNSAARIWADAGGFAPTIGIIGAVLGLIHVMGNLSDTSKLGAGIAVAFVATVYGVASANLIFIPIGNKIKSKIRKQMVVREMILEGAVGLISGYSPIVIEQKLNAFLDNDEWLKV